MPSVLSKLYDTIFMPDWSMPFNCYEIAHPWNVSCTETNVELSLKVFEQGLKIYIGLYMFHFLIKRKYDGDALISTLKSVIRSSAFLGFNTFAMFSLLCAVGKLTGRFYYSLTAVVPAFFGSLMAIFIEEKSRIRTLAIYSANIASECLYRIAARRGIIHPIKYGEVFIFSASISLLLYFLKKRGLERDIISLVLKILLGPSEFRKSNFEINNNNNKEKNNNEKLPPVVIADSQVQSKSADNGKLAFIQSRHESCYHAESSCLRFVLDGFTKPFALAMAAQIALKAFTLRRRVLQEPRFILTIIKSPRTINTSLFAATFAGLFRSVSCYLRWFSDGRKDWHPLVAGSISGTSMILTPNSTISINIMWRLIEHCYFHAVRTGTGLSPEIVLPILYAASVNIIFYTLILEPSCLRASITKFFDQVSEHRIHQMNRGLLKIFGTGAHIGYEDYFPDLDPKRCSPAFLETVLIWAL